MSEEMREVVGRGRKAAASIAEQGINGWGNTMTDLCDALEAALQESEAGAKNDSMATALLYHLEREAFGQVISPQLAADIRKHLNAMKPVYLASPAAQAIETAAYMRAAEVCERVTGYGAEACHDTILALIPQDGRTQLEQKCMEVAQEVKSATVFNECRNMLTKENELRAIVTNLIGATK